MRSRSADQAYDQKKNVQTEDDPQSTPTEGFDSEVVESRQSNHFSVEFLLGVTALLCFDMDQYCINDG